MFRYERSLRLLTAGWKGVADNLYRIGSARQDRRFPTILAGLLLVIALQAACSNLTGWRIPGTEKSAVPTTTTYLVLENVETLPEDLRSQGEIYVDDAFFGRTTRPTYYRFVGNALVVGKVHIEKEKIHTIRVEFPGYEPFENTRYFGTLPEYSLSFRLKQVAAEPAVAWEAEEEVVPEKEKTWYEFWRWFEK